MLNYTVKSKVTDKGLIVGIVLNNGKEDKFIPKNKFGSFSDNEFLNAKISSDGKVFTAKGKIPLMTYEDYMSNIKPTGGSGSVILYHGSDHVIEKPRFGAGKSNNDYGVGFYCTQDKDLACEWSCQGNRLGVANVYELDYSKLKVLELGTSSYEDIMRWLTILINNRSLGMDDKMGIKRVKKFLNEHYMVKDYRSYDLIRGYRADDSYFSFAKDFLNNQSSFTKMSQAMFLGKLGIQEVLISKKAFSLLKYKGYINAEERHRIFYSKRDNEARNAYKRIRDSEKNLLIEDIIRRGY